nr:hypothetical protein [Mycobacterium sp. SMC-2]
MLATVATDPATPALATVATDPATPALATVATDPTTTVGSETAGTLSPLVDVATPLILRHVFAAVSPLRRRGSF